MAEPSVFYAPSRIVRLIRSKPTMIVSDAGITINGVGNSSLTIEWSEIAEVFAQRWMGRGQVFIQLKDREQFFAKQGPLLSRAGKLAGGMRPAPFAISESTAPLREVLAAVRRHSKVPVRG